MAEFVDALINKKYPEKTGDELAVLREEAINSLESQINSAILEDLSEPQLAELNDLLDAGDEASTPVTYRDFFKRAGVDVNQKTKTAMTAFAQEFLGDLYGNE